MTAIYITDLGSASARFFLATAPAVAIMWAFGIGKVLAKDRQTRRIAAYEVSQVSRDLAGNELLGSAKRFVNRLNDL